MEAQGLIQCLDSFLRKVSDFLTEVLAAELLSAPAMLKKLELIDNLDFIKFYHDPVSFIKNLVQKSGNERAGCRCKTRGFCVLPASPRVLRARLEAFSRELQESLSNVTVTTAASSLLVRRRDLVEADREGWLTRVGSDAASAVGSGSTKYYAVLCDAFLALFRSSSDADEIASPVIVLTEKYTVEDVSQSGYQFTICGGGDRYAFVCKTQDEMQNWLDCILFASRLRLADIMETLKSTAAAKRPPGSHVDAKQRRPTDRQPPEGAAAADPPSSFGGSRIGSASVLSDPKPDTKSAAAHSAPGSWSLDLSGFSIPSRHPAKHAAGRQGDAAAGQRKRSVSSSKSSLSLYQSTVALLGTTSGASTPRAVPRGVASESRGRSPTVLSLRDNLVKKPSPGTNAAGVKLRHKRSAAAALRRVQSLVIENSEGTALLDQSSYPIEPGAHRRSIGARISLSASALFNNLAVVRSAQRLAGTSSSERAKALLTAGCGVADFEGCLQYRSLLKWSKVHCKVLGDALYAFKDSGGAPGELVLQVELRGSSVTETAADDAKVKKPYGLKLLPACSSKPMYFAADTSDDLHRWLAILQSHSGSKTATLREPAAGLTKGAQEMVELGERDASSGESRLHVSSGSADGKQSKGVDDDDCDWPGVFSETTDLMGGLGFLTASDLTATGRGSGQQGITLPSSPQHSSSTLIIENEDTSRSNGEVEFQPEAVVWLSPASSVHSVRSTPTNDGPPTNAAINRGMVRDDLDMRQLSLDRRQTVLRNMIQERERLQAALNPEKHGQTQSCLQGERKMATQPSSNGQCKSGKQRSSWDDINMLKQQMEGLKDKMRSIDKGMRQSLDPSLLFQHEHGLREQGESDEEREILMGPWWNAEPQKALGVEPRSFIRSSSEGLPLNGTNSQQVQPVPPQGGRFQEGDINASGKQAILIGDGNAGASSRERYVPSTAGNGLELGTWNDLRCLIDSIDGGGSQQESTKCGHLIVLGDV